MFAERFDALMNIAEVSNSFMGRYVNINPSHIGRLRSGIRPLPKNHDYLTAMCRCLVVHIKKDYQINSLQKLTGISNATLCSSENTALYLEQWLLKPETDTSEAMKRVISGFSRISVGADGLLTESEISEPAQQATAYLYGNAGKRKAVEQFFIEILQEDIPQTLLLFSDENMEWLYEDAVFAKRWAELLIKVILKGNRVKIIHTVSRDINEMLEAVNKWIPIYMTGMIEPYYYPRLRDGIFRRTLFIAPNTAAVVSSSVQQDTDGMLNLFLTDKEVLAALVREYGQYFSLCRPLMHIFTNRDMDTVRKTAGAIADEPGDELLCMSMPPLFTIPEENIRIVAEQTENATIYDQWARSSAVFKQHILKHRLTLVIQDPEIVHSMHEIPCSFRENCFYRFDAPYTMEQYDFHLEHLYRMEEQYENLRICLADFHLDDTLLYVKEDNGVVMAKLNAPQTVFIINEKNMISAFWDYVSRQLMFPHV